jgi:hypothetical protein
MSVCAVPAFPKLVLADLPQTLPLQASDDDFDDVASAQNVDADADVEVVGARALLVRQRLHEIDPAYLEGIIFGTPRPQSIEAAGMKLGSIVQIKIETIDLACGLDLRQRQKLRLAGAGDIKRLFDRIEELQGKWRFEQGAVPQAMMRKAIDLRNSIAQGPFGGHSLFGKTLDGTLTAAQRARSTEFGGIDRLDETVRIRAWPEAADKFKDIWLTATPFGDDGLERLQSQTSVQRLFIDSTRITDAGLVHVARLTNLEELDLERTGINGSGLVHFGNMQRLKILKLGYTQATDECLAHIQELTALKALMLEGTKVTSRGLKSLRSLTQLEVLSLYETQVTDAGLVDLAPLKNLRQLDLEGTQVSDAGLAHLGELAKLRVLDLRRTQVTDAGLGHLEQLMSVKSVYLYGTQVTEAGIANLKRSLPGAKLIR